MSKEIIVKNDRELKAKDVKINKLLEVGNSSIKKPKLNLEYGQPNVSGCLSVSNLFIDHAAIDIISQLKSQQ